MIITLLKNLRSNTHNIRTALSEAHTYAKVADPAKFLLLNDRQVKHIRLDGAGSYLTILVLRGMNRSCRVCPMLTPPNRILT